MLHVRASSAAVTPLPPSLPSVKITPAAPFRLDCPGTRSCSAKPQKAPWVIKVLITLHIFMDAIKNKTAIKKIADCRAKKARRTQFPPEAPDGHTDKQIAFHYQFLECVKNGRRCQYVARDES